MKEAKTTIGFRLSGALRKLLGERAAEHGLSPGAYARLLVTEALLDEKAGLLLEELRELRQLLVQLERHHKTATVALLVDAGKAGVEDAEAFVRENLS